MSRDSCCGDSSERVYGARFSELAVCCCCCCCCRCVLCEAMYLHHRVRPKKVDGAVAEEVALARW